MAEEEGTRDFFISLDSTTLSLPSSLSQTIQWAASLHWWEWLLMAKAVILFWILNITIVLPSIFMQVGGEAGEGWRDGMTG